MFRFKGGNSDGFSSKSGRFVSLAGVAGGDDESVDGGEEGDCRCFFRLRELYVRWTLEDINFDAGGVARGVREDATRLFGLVYIIAAWKIIEPGHSDLFTHSHPPHILLKSKSINGPHFP